MSEYPAELLSVVEAAARAGVTRDRIYKATRQSVNPLPVAPNLPRRCVRFLPADIDAWRDRDKSKGGRPPKNTT